MTCLQLSEHAFSPWPSRYQVQWSGGVPYGLVSRPHPLQDQHDRYNGGGGGGEGVETLIIGMLHPLKLM